jgi:sterol desaturase/sphingolipid hydroxylase (fatty acid hydroxylase superfamily)
VLALSAGAGFGSAPLDVRERLYARRVYLPGLVLAGITAALVWLAIETLSRSQSLGRVLAAGRAELVAPVVVALVAGVTVCERLWPAQRRKLLAKGHVHDALYLALHVVAVVPLMTLLSVAFAELLVSHAAWMEVSWTSSWPRWPLLGLTLVLMDGANWAAHWADHRSAPLWRMHALHHSQEELSVLTSFRAHPLSHLAGFFLATFPVVVLMGHRGMAPELVTAYVCLGTLPHANVRWSFGALGKIVVSPAYHRLHHSFEGSLGLNLGVVLTVWDVLAGRARFPGRDDQPCITGLPARPVRTELQGDVRWHLGLMVAQLAEPFRPVPATAWSIEKAVANASKGE